MAGGSPVRALLSKSRIDPYILAMLATVALASLTPARGGFAAGLHPATSAVIGLLFFLYGTRLSARQALDGLTQWRLHTLVFTATFILFPMLGLAGRLLVGWVLTPQLYAGLLFLCCLPSTVQSSIAFTSIARGNVAAAICAASFSNLMGIVLTPLFVAGLLATKHGGVSLGSIHDIMVQLMAPFLAGQLLRRWLARFVSDHKRVLGLVDKGSILLVVYTAFSEGMVAGIWHHLSPASLLLLLATNAALLATVLAITTMLARQFRFSREDEITIVFCGSKKSLASGIPIATVLFPAHTLGLVVLPLMLFHQMQLMACAWLARRYASDTTSPVQPAKVTAANRAVQVSTTHSGPDPAASGATAPSALTATGRHRPHATPGSTTVWALLDSCVMAPHRRPTERDLPKATPPVISSTGRPGATTSRDYLNFEQPVPAPGAALGKNSAVTTEAFLPGIQ